MSSRRFIFTRHQMYYTCDWITYLESQLETTRVYKDRRRRTSLVNPFTSAIPRNHMSPRAELFQILSHLKLKSDALEAFSGILSRLTETNVLSGFIFDSLDNSCYP